MYLLAGLFRWLIYAPQFLFDHLLELLEVPIFQESPVNKHRRCSPNTYPPSISQIPDNQPLHVRGADVPVETFHIEAECFDNFQNFGIAQTPVVFEQLTVKLPEPPLCMGRKGGCSCFFRKSVTGKGVVLENELDLFGVILQHLLEQRLEPRAGGSLVIAEHGNGYGGMLGALKGQSGDIQLVDCLELNDLYRLLRRAGQYEGAASWRVYQPVEAFTDRNSVFHRIFRNRIDENLSSR